MPIPHYGHIVLSHTDLTYQTATQQRYKKPDYFDVKTDFIGAHISVFYPNEDVSLYVDQLGQKHDFTLNWLGTAKAFEKRYYARMIEASTLTQMRNAYGQPSKLNLKGKWISSSHCS